MLKRLFAWLFGTNKKNLPVVPVVLVSVSPDKIAASHQARAALDRAQRMHNERMDRVLLRKPQSGRTRTRVESRRVQKSSAEGDGFMAVTMMGYGGVNENDDYHRSGTGHSHYSQSSMHSGHSSHSKFANGNDPGFGGDGGCDGGGGGDGGGGD